MGPFASYVIRVLDRARRHSLDLTQTIIFVLFLVVGATTYFLPKAANWETFINGWLAPVLVLAGIISVRLLLAPYWLHQELTVELAQFKTSSAIEHIKPFDLGKWAKIDPLTLTQAAWLWCDFSPRLNLDGNDAVQFAYEQLRRAVIDGKIKPKLNKMQELLLSLERSDTLASYNSAANTKVVNEQTLIPVIELRLFAETTSERPGFLFPPQAIEAPSG